MNMRTPAVASAALLILLLLLATRAHGIRLDRQLHEAINSKKMADPKAGDAKASIAGDSVKNPCTPDGRCSGQVKKALLAHAEAAAEAKQQSNSTGNDHSTAAVAGEAAATQQARSHEAAETTSPAASSSSSAPPERQQTYPDMMDIAGMDYSPATRKPPIHN